MTQVPGALGPAGRFDSGFAPIGRLDPLNPYLGPDGRFVFPPTPTDPLPPTVPPTEQPGNGSPAPVGGAPPPGSTPAEQGGGPGGPGDSTGAGGGPSGGGVGGGTGAEGGTPGFGEGSFGQGPQGETGLGFNAPAGIVGQGVTAATGNNALGQLADAVIGVVGLTAVPGLGLANNVAGRVAAFAQGKDQPSAFPVGKTTEHPEDVIPEFDIPSMFGISPPPPPVDNPQDPFGEAQGTGPGGVGFADAPASDVAEGFGDVGAAATGGAEGVGAPAGVAAEGFGDVGAAAEGAGVSGVAGDSGAGGGGECFPGFVKVALPGGDFARIDSLKAGDLVLAFDFHTNKLVPATIKETIKYIRGFRKRLRLINDMLMTIPHKIAVGKDEWKEAGDINGNERWLALNNETRQLTPKRITLIDEIDFSQAVYNLEIERHHNFLISDGGKFSWLVHNGGK